MWLWSDTAKLLLASVLFLDFAPGNMWFGPGRLTVLKTWVYMIDCTPFPWRYGRILPPFLPKNMEKKTLPFSMDLQSIMYMCIPILVLSEPPGGFGGHFHSRETLCKNIQGASKGKKTDKNSLEWPIQRVHQSTKDNVIQES